MPKDTFFRLPDDKRNRILKGAKKEFYNCTFSEASINRIIKDAEIPRGSFSKTRKIYICTLLKKI